MLKDHEGGAEEPGQLLLFWGLIVRLRSLSVSVLSALVLVPVAGSPALATDTPVLVSSPFKNSTTKAVPVAVPVVVAAPRVVAPAPTTSAQQTYQNVILSRTNGERTSRGLRALALSGCADRLAQAWAARLASVGALSHQNMTTVASTCGARGAGENVAYGNVSASSMVGMWMGSAGHRANILNSRYTHVGIGSVTTSSGRTYGVQVFLIG